MTSNDNETKTTEPLCENRDFPETTSYDIVRRIENESCIDIERMKQTHPIGAPKYDQYEVRDLQTYNPLYDVLFPGQDNTHVGLNRTYKAHDMESIQQINAVEPTKHKKSVHIKYAPLLDPIKYLIGKYDGTEESNKVLPKPGVPGTTKFHDHNNYSYIDSHFCFLSSQLLHTYGFVHGIDFFGSNLGIQKKYKINIMDEIQYLNQSHVFINKILDGEVECDEYPVSSLGTTSRHTRGHKVRIVTDENAPVEELQIDGTIELGLEENELPDISKDVEVVYSREVPWYADDDDDGSQSTDSQMNYTDDGVSEPVKKRKMRIPRLITRNKKDTEEQSVTEQSVTEQGDQHVTEDMEEWEDEDFGIHPFNLRGNREYVKKEKQEEQCVTEEKEEQSVTTENELSESLMRSLNIDDDDVSKCSTHDSMPSLISEKEFERRQQYQSIPSAVQSSDLIESDDQSVTAQEEEEEKEWEDYDEQSVTAQEQEEQSVTAKEQEDEDYDEDEEDYEEMEINAYIHNYPVNLICLERCDGTLDQLFDRGYMNEALSMAYIFQVIMTLIAYQKAFGFTHNDLHTNNIMYVNTDVEVLYYKYKGQQYAVPTYGRIIKIIDFGRSIYTVNGRTFTSDCYDIDGDAHSQYNTEPYFNPKKPRVDNNPSFDLCRLATAIYEFVIESNDDYSEASSYSNILDFEEGDIRRLKELNKFNVDKCNGEKCNGDKCNVEKCNGRKRSMGTKKEGKCNDNNRGKKEDPIYDDFQKLIQLWCCDDNNKNILYKQNGDERYPKFKLYKMIARTVHQHTPQKQLAFFDRFLINKDQNEDQNEVSKGEEDTLSYLPCMDLDALPCFM